MDDHDLETWLLDAGDAVIQKIAASKMDSLTPVERAIYCFWVIDYSVRNSGTLGAVDDLHPPSLTELADFAERNRLTRVLALIADSHDESRFCGRYYEHFGEACSDLKLLWDRI